MYYLPQLDKHFFQKNKKFLFTCLELEKLLFSGCYCGFKS